MGLIEDVKAEQKKIRRKVAVDTAKRVLAQFYKAVEREDAGTQTEIDQIEYLRKFYDSQIDSLFEQIDKLKKKMAECQKETDKAKANLALELKIGGDLRVRLAGTKDDLEEANDIIKHLRESERNLEYSYRKEVLNRERIERQLAEREEKIGKL